jgi:hypothetical protein
MTPGPAPLELWGDVDHRQLATVARNVSTRYLAIVTDAIIGFVLLPFNVKELGPSAYGLWMLTASMTTYFSVLDLGFGGSMVRFVPGVTLAASTKSSARCSASSASPVAWPLACSCCWRSTSITW